MIGILIILAICAFAYWMITVDRQRHQAEVAFYSQCEYLGSRINASFRGNRVWRFRCDGVIEETRRDPR